MGGDGGMIGEVAWWGVEKDEGEGYEGEEEDEEKKGEE